MHSNNHVTLALLLLLFYVQMIKGNALLLLKSVLYHPTFSVPNTSPLDITY